MAAVYESETTEFCYIPILKNASTWGRHIFVDHLGFKLKEKIFQFNPDKKYIIFLRDPVKRWLSGAIEYLRILKYDPATAEYLADDCQLDPVHLALICTIIRFDPHTVRQVDYIRECYPGLMVENTIYFDVGDKNFAMNVAGFLHKSFGVQLPTDKINTRMDNPYKVNVPFKVNVEKQILNFLDENPKYKKKIDMYYDRDRDFIKYVNFVT